MFEQRMHIDDAKARLKQMEDQLASMNGQDKSGYLSFQISEYKGAINAFEAAKTISNKME